MERIINCDNLNSFAYVNDAICKKPIRGIVISFLWLGSMAMHEIDPIEGEFYADEGILFVVPYSNPWAWMNKQTVAFTDEIIDVLIKKYQLGSDVRIITIGDSMGGQMALTYVVYAKHTPIACVVNCPVCDTVYHFTERPDLPRTLYSALYNEEGTLESALKTISPLHLVDRMPKISYYIFHCDEDKAVGIEQHSKAFMKAMKERGHNIVLNVEHGRDHCKLTYKMKKKFCDCVLENFKTDKV